MFVSNTQMGVAALIFQNASQLMLIAFGIWMARRFKTAGLPWVVACWIVNLPLLNIINSSLLTRLVGGQKISVPFSNFNIADPLMMYSFHLCMNLSAFLVTLLLLSDAAIILRQRGVELPAPLRALAWLQRFAFALGVIALLLAVSSRAVWLLMRHAR